VVFTLTDVKDDACQIEACSESQVFSIFDMGTNYCNLKMLCCGSKDGCKPVLHDFDTRHEGTIRSSMASVDLQKCLVV